MILTTCAACAAPLAHTAPRCVRCYNDSGATLDDLLEAVTKLEETERIARRVLGGADPLTMKIECAGWRVGARRHARENPNDDGGYVISIPLSRIDRA